jgi:hypothetical protein
MHALFIFAPVELTIAPLALDIGSFAELPKVGESVIVGHEYNTA